ncbi:MAG: GTP cyclohydrolase II [Cellvibrionales bacterium]|nr:MAG: GTP cyclohydrolase II [Cellvibrionales bacterium]HRF87516.1 GTP cyclohydrolase II [Pseudomonadales bacterium]HRG50255.1 GTP cyclohydrolase II [Pseudomonadales bacterium]
MPFHFVASSNLPTTWGEFTLHGFEDADTQQEHIALTMGDVANGEPVLARIHSECLTGDVLHSLRCDCGAQLHAAMQAIADEGRGLLLYLRQEGRGIGLMNKIRAYHLQDQGADTVEANQQLGFEADLRQYDMLTTMLKHLNISKLRLMTNNPRKLAALESAGIHIEERLPLQVGENPHNRQYLATKTQKLGHLLTPPSH